MLNCKPCGYYNNDPNKIKKHKQTTKHFLKTGEIIQEARLYCESCNFFATFNSTFDAHLKTKGHITRTSTPSKIHCKQCDYWTYQKSLYNQHMYRHRKKGDLNLKRTKIKDIKKSLEDLKNNDFCEDADILKNKISEIILHLYKEKIDPNNYFNYQYYCSKNIDLSIIELNDFYTELKSIIIY
jgi:hypothetical protein